MNPPCLEGRDLRVDLGPREVLSGVSVRLEPGEVVALIGPNGAGKSTLLRTLAGVLQPRDGWVRCRGRTRAELGREAWARSVAFVPQLADCHWPLPATQLVALGRLPHRPALAGESLRDRAAVATAMEVMGVSHLCGRLATEVSGGELRRLLLARALAGQPEVLLLDEPTAGLDPGHQLRLVAQLTQLAAEGRAILLSLHDLPLAARAAHRLVLLHRGRLAAAGPPDDVLTSPSLEAVYGVRLGSTLGPDGSRRWWLDGPGDAPHAPDGP